MIVSVCIVHAKWKDNGLQQWCDTCVRSLTDQNWHNRWCSDRERIEIETNWKFTLLTYITSLPAPLHRTKLESRSFSNISSRNGIKCQNHREIVHWGQKHTLLEENSCRSSEPIYLIYVNCENNEVDKRVNETKAKLNGNRNDRTSIIVSWLWPHEHRTPTPPPFTLTSLFAFWYICAVHCS